MIALYGIANCDTVKRARTALDEAGIAYRFHDFRKDGLAAERVSDWVTALGLDTVLNKRGTTWRQLDAGLKAEVEGGAAERVLAAHPSLIKRPVFERDGELRVGFAKADVASILVWLQA